MEYDRDVIKLNNNLNFHLDFTLDEETGSLIIHLCIKDIKENIYTGEFSDCLDSNILSNNLSIYLKDILSPNFIRKIEFAVLDLLINFVEIKIEPDSNMHPDYMYFYLKIKIGDKEFLTNHRCEFNNSSLKDYIKLVEEMEFT